MSPVRASEKPRYPPDWPAISRSIKERAGWRCECQGECGRHEDRCDRHHGDLIPLTGAKVVLTTAHLDHQPENCDPGNLRAFCQRCHLVYDTHHHAMTRRATAEAARRKAGQEVLI